MSAPYCVIYRDDSGGTVIERHHDPAAVNKRLNQLWGRWGRGGPERHKEARGVATGAAERLGLLGGRGQR